MIRVEPVGAFGEGRIVNTNAARGRWLPESNDEHSETRDWFAGCAIIALGNHNAVSQRGIPWLVEHAYMVADAMMAEREKSKEIA